ncbi:hypothetical protein PIB30_068843 [Stylosanthes scabra]|uniref:Uncharacterized protein n=1 Tax=Stylosanthes scabra TaxID=79078 RepID=A0ABU6ZLM8_9FABA|nr:hypothetical protein [Stylosanthes scabra]
MNILRRRLFSLVNDKYLDGPPPKEGSARVSRQEEDLAQRSTKKVKTRDIIDLNQPITDMEIADPSDGNTSNMPKTSYKESLLKPIGPKILGNNIDAEIPNDDEHVPENRWYDNAEEEDHREKPFDPCPIIHVSKDEFDEWCKPCGALP